MKHDRNLNWPVADAGNCGVFALDVQFVFCTSGSLLVCFAITADPVRGFPSGSFCGSEPTLTNVLRDLVKAEVTEPISVEQPSADWTSAWERQLHTPWLRFRHCHCCLVLIELWYKTNCVLWAWIMNHPLLYSVQSICESFCQTEAMEPAEISCALSRENARGRHTYQVSLANTSLWGHERWKQAPLITLSSVLH